MSHVVKLSVSPHDLSLLSCKMPAIEQNKSLGLGRTCSELSAGHPKLTPAHVVRSASKSNEFVQKWDQQKIYPTHMYFKGQYSLKSFTVGFLIFENSGF